MGGEQAAEKAGRQTRMIIQRREIERGTDMAAPHPAMGRAQPHDLSDRGHKLILAVQIHAINAGPGRWSQLHTEAFSGEIQSALLRSMEEKMILARYAAPIVLMIALVAVAMPANSSHHHSRDCRSRMAQCLVPDFSDFYAHRLAVRIVDLALDSQITSVEVMKSLTVLPINARRISGFADWYFGQIGAQWTRSADLGRIPYR